MHSRVSETLTADETAPGLSTLDLVVQQHESRTNRGARSTSPLPTAVPTTVIGRLVGFDADGRPLVTLPGTDSATPLPARSTQRLHQSHLNSEVVLIFADQDRDQPIIIGCLIAPAPLTIASGPMSNVELNGERLELTAQDEIVLRCGKSSITLTQAGKVIIRGEYLLSRSSGVNRIKGGSVQIN